MRKQRKGPTITQSIRVSPELVRDAKFFVDQEGLSYDSVSDFFRVIIKDWIKMKSEKFGEPSPGSGGSSLSEAIQKTRQAEASASLDIWSERGKPTDLEQYYRESLPDDFGQDDDPEE